MKTILKKLTLMLVALLLPLGISAATKPGSFTTGKGTFLLNGQPFTVKAAEMHYPRIPRPYWDHRIKMAKELGMNTVCIYVFWNIHEQQEGQFDFTGNNDIAAFCRLAQKNGMYVIVRPGPYVCAEWEMGGLPWWLLKKKDIRLREQDPYFMERVKIFEQKVGEQLKPLTIENGGPIIMIQVENEYGSYGKDKPYVSEIRDCLRGIYGQNVTLFQCDWSSNFENNGLDDLVWTMNFGTGANIDQQFRRLKQLRPDAPLMCSEFWSGWFDKWGARHETRPAKDMVDGMDEMLSKNISFSLYMTHGGTSFGHWAGANSPGFAPDVTSYDYDAPINEYGLATPKYYELQKMMQKYTQRKLGKAPKAPMGIIEVPQFELKEFAPLVYGCDGLSTGEHSATDLTFEYNGQGWGSRLYRTTLPDVPVQSVLKIEAHDYAQVWLNDKFIGKIDRVKNEKTLALPPVKKGDQLTVLVEAMGRINFGRAIKDFKGIVGNVTIEAEMDNHDVLYTMKNWEQWGINDQYETAISALEGFSGKKVDEYHEHFAKDAKFMGKRGYFRGYFNLKKVGDTFINMEAFGKGQIYVNGHALGRFWSIGPQQTLYVPGCWLKKGRNEVVVLDVVGPQGEAKAFCQNKPELDKLNLKKGNKHNDIGDKPDLNSATPVAAGAFKGGNGWQTVKLDKQAKGRFLAIECLSNQDGKDVSAIAEIYLQGADGKRISREPWTTKYADSEDENGNRFGNKVYDLQESTYWQTEKGAGVPHLLVIDLGSVQTVSAMEYLPRAEQGAPGSVKNYKIYIW